MDDGLGVGQRDHELELFRHWVFGVGVWVEFEAECLDDDFRDVFGVLHYSASTPCASGRDTKDCLGHFLKMANADLTCLIE